MNYKSKRATGQTSSRWWRPAGETPAIPFPFAEEEGLREVESALLRSRLRTRKTLTPEEQIIHRFGQQLFEVVFQGDVRSLFYESRKRRRI